MNNKRILLLLSLSFFVGLFEGTSQVEIHIDRFYKTVDSVLDCKKRLNFSDTILFVQKALYSYRNNEVNSNFDSFFKCYEPKYKNDWKGDSSIPTVKITSMYARCDRKYILLFFIDNYLLKDILKKNAVPDDIDVHSSIFLKNIKTGKTKLMSDENDQKALRKIYKKLIVIFNDKKLLNELLYKKKISPLAYIGYRWEFE